MDFIYGDIHGWSHKKTQSHNPLIFIMEISMSGKMVLKLKQGPGGKQWQHHIRYLFIFMYCVHCCQHHFHLSVFHEWLDTLSSNIIFEIFLYPHPNAAKLLLQKVFTSHEHRGPTDVEDDRPPCPKMARGVSASELCASIVTFHALRCWLFACELTYKVRMNSCECCIYGK